MTGRGPGLSPDRVAGLAIAGFGGLVVWQAARLPLGSLEGPGPGYLPLLLGILMAGLGLAIAGLRGAAPDGRLQWLEAGRALHVLGACAFAALALEDLGYRLTTAAILVYLIGVVERQRPIVVLPVAGLLSFGTYYVFAGLLQVQLPRGPWGL